VRLTLSSPQSWYQSGKTPRFTVHAMSTASQPCRFNMGTKFVAVVIASGNRHLWSSADCPGGAGSHPAVLTGSRPAVLGVSWDRRTSSPGCSGTTHLVRPGEYEAEAVAGRIHSAPVNVVLGAKGASGP
jgi:hypothetical protein